MLRAVCNVAALTMVVGGCRAFGLIATRPAASRLVFGTRSVAVSSRVLYESNCRPFQGFSALRASATSNEKENEVKPTWTYTPYQPPKQQRRKLSTREWRVPKSIKIPEDQVELSFVRSSGAGGQNVNKLNTKVELRFHVMGAKWLPHEVRERLVQQQANRVNKEGYMTLNSQEYRTQAQNRKAVMAKLEALILQAYPRPKERKVRKGISKAAKERNKEFKRKRSQVKKNRGRVDY